MFAVSPVTGEQNEFHVTYVWNDLGRWAATLGKGTPLLVEGELIYDQYGRRTEATLGKQTVEVEIPTRAAKIRVHRIIRLVNPGESEAASDAA